MTRSEVARARRTVIGCCSRFADNMACDCMEKAEPEPAPCLTKALVSEVRRLQRRIVDLTESANPNAVARTGL